MIAPHSTLRLAMTAIAVLCLRAQCSAVSVPLRRAADNQIVAQTLIREMKSQNSDLLSIAFHLVNPTTKIQEIVASTEDEIGMPDSPESIHLVQHGGVWIVESAKDGTNTYEVMTPFATGPGRVLGLLVISHRRDNHSGEAGEVLARQYRLGEAVAKVVEGEDFLYQPADYPMIKPEENRIFAEQLVEEVKAKHPELLAVMIHTERPRGPGPKTQQIIASTAYNIHSIDPAEEIDMTRRGISYINPGVNRGVKRYQISTPLRDRAGQIIGLLFINFRRETDGQEVTLLSLQNEIATDLAKRIPNVESLFAPADN